jgi:ubiquinone/menaquinone biosynthesis C-methylase UbiE
MSTQINAAPDAAAVASNAAAIVAQGQQSQHELPPEVALTQMIFGAFVSKAVSVAAELGVADLLAEQPQTVAALAAATSTHERSLYRVLRTLASVGVFRETGDKVFELTPLAEPLRADAPRSMRNGAIFMGAEWHWRVYGEMLHSVRTGKSAWSRANGAEVFDYLAANPEHGEVFNRAMTDISAVAASAITEAYDFTGIDTLVDVAGGHGYLLAAALRANPDARGVLFDLPQVIDGAPATLEREGVTDRVELSSGDFFASVPEGADAYMMKHIIHDWDDERALLILNNIRRAMRDDGRVLVCETVVPEGNEPHFGKLMDLEMLVSPGGVERTAREYRELLARAGLELKRIIPTRSYLSVVEAVKAAK